MTNGSERVGTGTDEKTLTEPFVMWLVNVLVDQGMV
jgi:hypothetical protein